MKILFVTDNKVNGFGGGSIESKKHYIGLKNVCGIKHELKVISMDSNLFEQMKLKIYKNKFIDIFVRFLGHSSFLYITMLMNKKKILEYNPDILYLSRSRFGFISKWMKKKNPKCRVITNIDNVEYDYVEGYFFNSKKFTKIKKMLERKCVIKDEKLTIKYSDELVFLTQRNFQRYNEIYGYKANFPKILPICLEKSSELTYKVNHKTIIFIGSLDYASNINAVTNLINLWEEKYLNNNKIELIIAGRNPSNDLIAQINNIKNAKIISNYEDARLIVPKNSLMLAPIEKGAGMKVKVAEALSFGILIAGSDEALVGYEEALNNELSKAGIFRCNTKEEYLKAIDEYIEKTDIQLEIIEKNQKKLFEQYYSYSRSNNYIKLLIKKLSKE